MIGVVGDGEGADRVATALEGAGLDVRAASAARLTDATPGTVAAVGESALVDLIEAGIDAPVLPVALDEGLPSVAVDDVRRTVDAFHAGETRTRQHPLLDIEVDGEPAGRAVFDAMLVRKEPGRISEYRLSAPTADSRFRADGVVAATPAGSHGYARAAGGPRVGLGADAVVVVPVAAFGLGAPTWVLDPGDGLELRVERDEGDVSLIVDGRARRTFSGQASVTLTPGGTLQTIAPLTD